MAGPKVLILGGGSGGLVAANKLVKILRDKVAVTVVDRNPYHEFMPAFPWVAMGIRSPDQVRRPLELLRGRGIEFINAEVVNIDPESRVVDTSRGKLAYDYLLVALGAEPHPEMVRGLKEDLAPWSMATALRLREHLSSFPGGRVVVGVASMYHPCPPAPYEVAGQIEFLLRLKGIRDKSSVDVFHLTPFPLANMGPVVGQLIADILKEKGVTYHANFELAQVDAENQTVISKDGRSLPYDMLVLVPPFAPNRVVAQSPLAGQDGMPQVSLPNFRSPKYPEVFLIGDLAAPALRLPPAGVVAHFQGEFVAGVIANEVAGTYMGEPFNPVAMCIMDFGDNALLPNCDFTPALKGIGMPSCSYLAKGKWVRITKMAFEAFWFATLIS
jgi:sulfide:quinone oxidoreductase